MPEQEQNAGQVDSVRSDDFVTFYANSAHIEITVWDVQLIFGELVRSGDKVVAEQRVRVIMSPQHAKALAGILNTNVREYESKIGPITLPQAETNPQEQQNGSKKK